MILSDNNGIEVTFFKDFPSSYKNIGVQISGGADSALILYLLTKMVIDRNQENDVKIWPTVGYDVDEPHNPTYLIASEIIENVKSTLKTDCIQPLHISPYIQIADKDSHLRAGRLYLKHHRKCETVVIGTSQGMPNNERDTEDELVGIKLIEKANEYTDCLPWAAVNKKFISYQYKKFRLDSLSKITRSCVINATTPCKKCWWCKERYWAFGSYDGGIQ